MITTGCSRTNKALPPFGDTPEVSWGHWEEEVQNRATQLLGRTKQIGSELSRRHGGGVTQGGSQYKKKRNVQAMARQQGL